MSERGVDSGGENEVEGVDFVVGYNGCKLKPGMTVMHHEFGSFLEDGNILGGTVGKIDEIEIDDNKRGMFKLKGELEWHLAGEFMPMDKEMVVNFASAMRAQIKNKARQAIEKVHKRLEVVLEKIDSASKKEEDQSEAI